MNLREWALPVYTILQQLATGALLVLWVIRAASRSNFNPTDIDEFNRNPILVIAFTVSVSPCWVLTFTLAGRCFLIERS